MILVTGGAGFIGSIVAQEVIDSGREAVVLDDLSRGRRDFVPDEAELVEADVADPAALAYVFNEHAIEAVVHLAAYALVGESMRYPNLYFRNNLAKSLALLDATVQAGVERFVFSSTCAVFGDRAPCPIAETAPKRPVNPYGESKLAFERALAWNRRVYGLDYFCLRYFNACGAAGGRGERREIETHLIPLALDAAAGARDPLPIYGTDHPTPDGTAIRDYVHVLDLADAHLRALSAPPELSGGYNVGSGRGASVRHVLDAVQRTAGRRVPTVEQPRRPGDPAELVADPSKIERELGWRATRTLEDAIRDAWAARYGADDEADADRERDVHKVVL